MTTSAVFLDRDGTIIEDVGYVRHPGEVRLLPGAAEAIRHLRESGYLVVVASNQSGVARGFLTEEELDQVHARMESLLEAEGAKLDGAYYCPFLDGPDAKVKAYRRDSELRKPRPGMLLKAAHELDIDLPSSWMIGDSDRDVKAGLEAGCSAIRLLSTNERSRVIDEPGVFAAKSLVAAVAQIDPGMAAAGEPTGRSPGPADGNRDADAVRVAVEDPAEREDVMHADEDQASLARQLEQISEQIERFHRRDRQQDFSLLRMFGSLLQMFAVVAAVWGVMALFASPEGETRMGVALEAVARFALATFLQVCAVSAFVLDRLR